MVRIGALAVAVLALLLAGCGTVHVGAGATDGLGAWASPGQWPTYGPIMDDIVRPRVDSSGRILIVGVHMPAGRYGCERDLTGEVTKFDQTYAYVSITYQSRLWLNARACPWRVVTIRVSLPAPLGQRNVLFNGATTFLASHGKLILLCDVPNGADCGIPSIPVRPAAPIIPTSRRWARPRPRCTLCSTCSAAMAAGWCSAWAGPAVPPGAMVRPAAQT